MHHDDDFSLGVHLTEHGYSERTDFNKMCKVCIIDNSSPNNIDVKEHKYIHVLNTLRPNGINVQNPFKEFHFSNLIPIFLNFRYLGNTFL